MTLQQWKASTPTSTPSLVFRQGLSVLSSTRAIPDGDGHLGEEPTMASEPGLGCRSVAGEGKGKEKKRKTEK
jgi:hypothetical protein